MKKQKRLLVLGDVIGVIVTVVLFIVPFLFIS